jgi:hypothetical protein
MTTIPVHVALIDDTATIPRAQLERVAGALNEQLQDDVVRHWTHVRATVGTGRGAAPGQWSIRIREQLDRVSHDRRSQPAGQLRRVDGGLDDHGVA